MLGACGEKEVTKEDKALDDAVVATIDGVKVSQADYNVIFKMLYDNFAQYSAQFGENWFTQPYSETSTLGQYIEDSTKRQIEQFVVTGKVAKEKYGIDVESDKIKDAAKKKLNEYKENLGGEENYAEMLKSMRTTDKGISQSFKMIEVFERFQKEITKEGEAAYVDKEDALKEFSEGKLRVQHILVSTQSPDSATGEMQEKRSDKEALKIARKVLAELEKGKDFDSLIEKYNEDPGMSKGKFYVFGDGEMVPEFEQASKELKVGEYTKEAVKTDYGYHIIKKYEIDSTVSEFQEYKQQLEQSKLTDVITTEIEKSKIDWEDKKISKYVLDWVNDLRKEENLEPLTEDDMKASMPTEEEIQAEIEKEAEKK